MLTPVSIQLMAVATCLKLIWGSKYQLHTLLYQVSRSMFFGQTIVFCRAKPDDPDDVVGICQPSRQKYWRSYRELSRVLRRRGN
jgi:hypothetical protein